MRMLLFALALAAAPLLTRADAAVTSASASTGGVHASGGQTVVTGDVSASVSTNVVSNDSGGTSTVDITTTENGVTHTQHSVKTYGPGQSISVSAGTSTGTAAHGIQPTQPASAEKPKSSQLAQTQRNPATTSAVSNSISTSTKTSAASTVLTIVVRYLASVFAVFGWW